MREILFRGKRLENGEWVEGDLMHCNEMRTRRPMTCIRFLGPAFCIFEARIDPATVGQYTGLMDKNGKRIFEGDVFEPIFGDGVGVVKYGEYRDLFGGDTHGGHIGFYVDWVSGREKDCLRLDLGYWAKAGNLILGNIHDNPELIGGGAE